MTYPGLPRRLEELFQRDRGLDEKGKPRSKNQFALDKHLMPQNFNKWLAGKVTPEPENVMRLAEVFDVPWEYIVVGPEGFYRLKPYIERLEREASHPPPPASRPPSRPKTIAIRKEAAG